MGHTNNCSKCGFLSECTRINFKHNEEHCRWHFKPRVTAVEIDKDKVLGTIETVINEVE